MKIYQPVISGSLTVTGSSTFIGSVTLISGSLSGTSSLASTASSADTFLVRNDLTASSAVVTGTLTAQTLVVQTITSSIVYTSGSNRFGSLLTDRQTFTGSLQVTGSYTQYGNMGIGVVAGTNGAKFISAGGATSFFDAAGSRGISIYPSSAGNIHQITSDYIAQSYYSIALTARGNNNDLFISSSGNIGIGTTSPLSKLHINTGTNQNLRIRPGTDVSATNGIAINSRDDADATLQQLSLRASDVLMLVTGNVGIGLTNPSYALDVSGGSSNVYIRAITSGTSNWSTLLLQNGLGTWHITNDNAGTFNIGTTGDPSVNQKLTISGSNVGIGITSPSYFLDVAAGTNGNFAIPAARISTSTGGAGGATILQINHTANSVSGLQIAQYGATPGNYTSIVNTENSYMMFGTNNTERMRLTSTGSNATLGSGGVLKLLGTGGSVGNYTELQFYTYNAPTNQPPVSIGIVKTDNGGYENGEFYIATKASNANVAPTERLRVKSDGTIDYGSMRNYNGGASKTVSTTPVTIQTTDQYGGGNSGNLTIVSGIVQGNGGIGFVDLVLWMYGGSTPTVISSQTTGAVASRTYSVSTSANLQLAMGSSTYYVSSNNFRQSYTN